MTDKQNCRIKSRRGGRGEEDTVVGQASRVSIRMTGKMKLSQNYRLADL